MEWSKERIKAPAQVELVPLALPQGFHGRLVNSQGDGAPAVQLFAKDLDYATLSALVEDFRERLLKEAGVQEPPRCAQQCPHCSRAF